MKSINESISTPIIYECDVLVAGGGVAGISAAMAAARAGARVILVDRGFMLGGLATAGLVTIYLPLCDGCGRQVTFGIAEELFHLSIEHGAEDRYPTAWLADGSAEERKNQRFEVQFNPQLFAISAERVLLSLGVRVLYGAQIAAVNKTEKTITEVIIEGKSGREAIAVGSVVDATGDADVCHLAGEDTVLFEQGNLLAAWFYGYSAGEYRLNMCGYCDIPEEDREKGQRVPTLVNRRFGGLSTEELSEMTYLSHRAVEQNILKGRKDTPDLIPTTISTIPQVRMTRRVDGITTLDTADDRRRFDDAVGTFSNWKKRGPIYELPLSSLYGRRVRNLITAGRCTAATEAMWDVTRVIPVCAVSGEAAGVAAAFSRDFASADVAGIQEHLRSHGVRVHIDELGIE